MSRPVNPVHLATIRKAAHLTQVATAERMGIKQAAGSSLERRDDMLLSTLCCQPRLSPLQ